MAHPPRAEAARPPPGYRPGVGLVLINPAGLVWIGERNQPVAQRWQMPQGGIDPGETPLAAAWRELEEEVGTKSAELLAESRFWYCYDVPAELVPEYWQGRYHGQSQKWFAFRFIGDDREIDVRRAENPEFVRWRWARPNEILALVVPFKRQVYKAVFDEFRALLES